MGHKAVLSKSIRNILSINFNHDGAGVVLSDGKVLTFINTERFSRRKKHPGMRESDLNELLRRAGLGIDDVDHVLLCNIHSMDSPDIAQLHGTYLKETWFEFWVNQTLSEIKILGRRIPCTVNPCHHLLHCAAAYFTSPFTQSLCFSADPIGRGAYVGTGHSIFPITDFRIPFSIAGIYDRVARQLFGSGLFGAGKLMALAPYGKSASKLEYSGIHSLNDLLALQCDDDIYINDGISRWNATLAYHTQRCLEVHLAEVLCQLYQRVQERGIEPNLCLSGGTALNCVANQIAFEQSGFKQLHMLPASGDDGTAIGAALWYWHDQLGNPRTEWNNKSLMYTQDSYNGLVEDTIRAYSGAIEAKPTSDYIALTADLLADGRTVAWFQGGSEIGPRALGNRSILADPRRTEMRDVLNASIKCRESFRPYAPAVLSEFAYEWFGVTDSPFMLRAGTVLKDSIPAVTHVDRTARVQTVSQIDNLKFYSLIRQFFLKTGVPVLLNTSFNGHNEPIVETPRDAIECFIANPIDYLVFPEIIVQRKV